MGETVPEFTHSGNFGDLKLPIFFVKSIQIGDGVNSAEEKEICKTKRADFMTDRLFECGFKDYSSLKELIASHRVAF